MKKKSGAISGIDLETSRLKFSPTNAKVNSNVTPNPNDIIVIGVIPLDWVIFFILTLKEILGWFLNLFKNNIITLDNKKNIDKQIKKAPKYARLIIGLSEPNIKIEISIDKNIKLIADDFFVYLNFKLWNTFLNKLDAFTCSIAFIVGIEKMASTSLC